MKRKLLKRLVLASVLLHGLHSGLGFAATAPVQLVNNSLRMHRGPCSCGFGLTYYIYFSTYYTEETWQANEELAPTPPGSAYNHWSYLLLQDASMFTSVVPAQMNLPTQDADGNGVSDFFDVSRPVGATTYGTVPSSLGSGTLTFSWSRAAGSSHGTCDLTLKMPILGIMGPFHHTFDLAQYDGSVTYTAGDASIKGIMTLTVPGDPTQQLQGPVEWVRSTTNRLNQLTLLSGTWTNADGTAYTFAETEFIRSATQSHTYQGIIQFDSGIYSAWTVAITDPNDSDHDGIPDLSDDAALPPPRRPELTLARKSTQLELTIRGDPGHQHLVQEASTPNPTSWTTVQTLTLTTDPQTVTLPLSPDTAKFWRVVAQ